MNSKKFLNRYKSYPSDLPNPPLKLPTDTRRIADCILTEHHFKHEMEIFSSNPKRINTVTYRMICTHCGAYSIHAEEVGVDGSSIFPTITVPIHRGPDGRMYAYWKKEELNLILDNHNAKVHENIREAKNHRLRRAGQAIQSGRHRVHPGGVPETPDEG